MNECDEMLKNRIINNGDPTLNAILSIILNSKPQLIVSSS